jgi:hypothetical protein
MTFMRHGSKPADCNLFSFAVSFVGRVLTPAPLRSNYFFALDFEPFEPQQVKHFTRLTRVQ